MTTKEIAIENVLGDMCTDDHDDNWICGSKEELRKNLETFWYEAERTGYRRGWEDACRTIRDFATEEMSP